MDSLLQGQDPEAKIVAVYPAGEGLMRIYARKGKSTVSRDSEFYPFFFISDTAFLKGLSSKHWIGELTGKGFYKYICAFSRWSDMWKAVHHVIDRFNVERGTEIGHYSELEVLHVRSDPVSQFLMQTGKSLFKQMEFEDLYRLQIDVLPHSGSKRNLGSAHRAEDRADAIALSDNRDWKYVIDGTSGNERQMLLDFVQIVVEKDPDIIEGHYIHAFDLPYLLNRCEIHGVPCTIGRDGLEPRSFDSRSGFVDRASDHAFHEIPGRHVIDTWHLAQLYDASKRILEPYDLTSVARYFGARHADIAGEDASRHRNHETDVLLSHAFENVSNVRLLSEHLSPAMFHLTQVAPLNFGNLVRTGSAARIESILLREYVRQKHSIPQPQEGPQTGSGFNEMFFTGVLEPVLQIDVASLYASVMISEEIVPRSDELGVFQEALKMLSSWRLGTNKRIRLVQDSGQQLKLAALQSMYKTLVDSFYGYLGYTKGLFNDYAAADRAAEIVRELLGGFIDRVTKHGGRVVLVDTECALVVPPPDVTTEIEEQRFIRRISRNFKKGINLTIEGRYRRIVSYRKKNYATLGYDGRIHVKGSAWMPRSMEKFGRTFVSHSIDALLNNDIRALHHAYERIHSGIRGHKWTVHDFARTEILKDSATQYLKETGDGTRNKSAGYEVALASNVHWKPGDRISYYSTGTDVIIKGFENYKLSEEWDPNFPDENTAYYLKRLDELAKKFQVFFQPHDFHAIFSVDDLFGFTGDGISIQNSPVLHETIQATEEEIEPIHVDPKIWLDVGNDF